MIGKLRLPQMPIAAQLMALLVGVLIAAQGATLLLTLVFPPQPLAQHSLEDIARTLKRQTVVTEGARPLVRRLSDTAPHPDGPGWLVASGPRDRLAALLGASTDDVILMFYVPLPAGAQVTAPTRPGLPPEDQPQVQPRVQPETEPASPAPQTIEPAGDGQPAVVLAAFEPQQGNPLLIRASYSPSGPPAPFAPASAPPFPGARRSGLAPMTPSRAGASGQMMSAPSPAARPTAQSRRPWADGPALTRPSTTSGRPALQGASGRNDLYASADAARPQVVSSEAWPRPISAAPDRNAAPRLAAVSDQAKAMVNRFNGRSTGLGSGGVVLGGAAMASAAPSAAPAPQAADTPAPAPVSPPTVRPAAASIAPVDTPPAPSAPPHPVAKAQAPLPQADRAAELLQPVVAAPTPVRRGLFAPMPAGYVEGDFIAAQRVGDRWIVVEPQPDGFPTAWQSRVMLWFLLSFALVAPFGWWFARRITAPLGSFADAAERLGRDPTASAPVQGGSAEIGRAAAAFNQMQGRLKRYVDDRTAMIGAISHDLRTPLTRMRFRLEAAPDRMKAGFENDIDQMEAMITSVLAFMRDQSEGGSRQRLDLRSLLNNAVHNAVAGGADVALEPGEPIEVDADAVALNRVFANLLDNAVKYGDRAVVQLVRQGDHAVAAVRDFGPGLPESELERVFKPFYRTPGAASGEAPGIGLGLANSRAIVLAHGGAIRLTSDQGLTAEVRLPVAV